MPETLNTTQGKERDFVDVGGLKAALQKLKTEKVDPELNKKADNEGLQALAGRVLDIEDVIPSAAGTSNPLADKAFVNSSIATATAEFRGTFNSMEELEAVTGADANDYGYVRSMDNVGNVSYSRYKYSDGSWLFEYAVNNTTFTAAQWAAINSGVTAATLQGYLPISGGTLNGPVTATSFVKAGGSDEHVLLAGGGTKAISSFLSSVSWDDVRNKPSFATVATSGSYDDLTGKPSIPTVPTKVSAFQNDAGYTGNVGTVTGVKMNGISMGTSGVVDLGTVITSHQDISGKADKNAIPTKVSQLTNDSGFTSNVGTVTQVKLGTTAYSPSGGVVSLPAYPTVPTNLSQLSNDTGFITGITKSMVVNALGYTPPSSDTNTWRGIQNNLTSTSTTDSLSAAMGKKLQDEKMPLTGVSVSDMGTSIGSILALNGNNSVGKVSLENLASVLGGGFGYVTQITDDSAINFNNATESGIYQIFSDYNKAKGLPRSLFNYGTLVVFNANGYCAQLYMPMMREDVTASKRIAIRFKEGSAEWRTWFWISFDQTSAAV